jgi:hypothetical protein
MKFTLLLFSSLCIQTFINAQQQRNNFVLLYSGEKVFAKEVILDSKLFKKDKIVVDSSEFELGSVKFYKSTEGFFANIKHLNSFESSSFAERYLSGKINLFKKTNFHTSMNMGGFNGGFGNGMPTFNSHVTETYYYNFDEFGELKPAKYKYLSEDLVDNSKSMFHLNKYKKNTKATTILYVVGGLLATIGTVDLIGKTENVPSDEVSGTGTSYTFMISGAITAGVGALLSLGKERHIENAIDAYNERY